MRKPTKSEEATLEYYNELGLDSLYVMIGRTTERDRGIQYSPNTALEKGKAWMVAHEEYLHKKICVEWKLCKKMARTGWKTDIAALVVTLADQIVAPSLGNIPPLLVVTVLAKTGLQQFCQCNRDRM
jgi:hypothetical protein